MTINKNENTVDCEIDDDSYLFTRNKIENFDDVIIML